MTTTTIKPGAIFRDRISLPYRYKVTYLTAETVEYVHDDHSDVQGHFRMPRERFLELFVPVDQQ